MSNAEPKAAAPPENNTQEKIQAFEESAKTTCDSNACEAAGPGQAQAHKPQEENEGILQQTGEQVASMAQGAIDGVKRTLGIGESK